MDLPEIIAIGSFVVGAVLVWCIFSVARVAVAGDDARAYKKMLRESEATAQQTIVTLSELREQMRAVDRRLGSIEKMMRDVG